MITRRGAVLLLVVLAIVCLTVLLAGLAFASREDYALSTAARSSQRAFITAERSLWLAAATLDSSQLAWPVGEQRPVHVSPGSADSAGAAIRRIAPALFVVSGEAGVRAAGGGHLWRRTALFVRAAVDSLGGVTFLPLPVRSWAELPHR
ncbi:MAG TPA: hypothetical protein VMM17_08520 [Gemmatimonadaceae bacterium]|nr:hypothetical protein [Gemmatimonadaceae bacterium]